MKDAKINGYARKHLLQRFGFYDRTIHHELRGLEPAVSLEPSQPHP